MMHLSWGRALFGVNLVLALALGVAAGGLVAVIVGQQLAAHLPEKGSSSLQRPDSEARKVTLADHEVILQRNLFSDSGPLPYSFLGEAGESTSPAAPPVAGGSVTLHGTVAGGGRPLALLKVGGELVILAVGEELPGGGVLEQVERNQVQVRGRDGRLLILPLVEGAPLQSASGAERTNNAAPASGGEFQVEQLGEGRWRIPAEEAERARGQFNTLLRSARMTPNLVDGETQGFLVVQVQPRSLLYQLGIRPRDVLMEVNGIPLDSAEKALQIFYQLREARRVNLALVRGDERLSYEYEVN